LNPLLLNIAEIYSDILYTSHRLLLLNRLLFSLRVDGSHVRHLVGCPGNGGAEREGVKVQEYGCCSFVFHQISRSAPSLGTSGGDFLQTGFQRTHFKKKVL